VRSVTHLPESPPPLPPLPASRCQLPPALSDQIPHTHDRINNETEARALAFFWGNIYATCHAEKEAATLHAGLAEEKYIAALKHLAICRAREASLQSDMEVDEASQYAMDEDENKVSDFDVEESSDVNGDICE
jgi:hypothetical protein